VDFVNSVTNRIVVPAVSLWLLSWCMVSRRIIAICFFMEEERLRNPFQIDGRWGVIL